MSLSNINHCMVPLGQIDIIFDYTPSRPSDLVCDLVLSTSFSLSQVVVYTWSVDFHLYDYNSLHRSLVGRLNYDAALVGCMVKQVQIFR